MYPNYEQRQQEFQATATALQERYTRLGWVRLVVFIGLVALLIVAWRELPWWAGLLGTLLSIFGFARLVRQHEQVQAAGRHQQHLADLQGQELASTQHDHRAWPTGEVFVDPQHPYTYDLDIFGAYSLYQKICRAHTRAGQQLLADWLAAPSTTELVEARQVAVTELAQQTDWQHHLRAQGAALDESPDQIKKLHEWLALPAVVQGNTVRTAALWVAPILFTVAMALWATVWPWYLALLLLVPAGLVLRGSFEEIQQLHALTGKAAQTLRAYAAMLEQVESATFTAPRLVHLQRQIGHEGSAASTAIRKLAYRLSQLDVRYNAFVFLLEFSVVWDLQQAYLLDKWKAKYRDDLPRWFAALAELEALVSLGNLQLNHPAWSLPQIKEERRLTAHELGHPLLSETTRVTNEMAMPTHGHIHLITGSNMAGKSTWLRTVGINIVLALAGSPVCAKRMELSPMQVYTSMRTTDALHESTSSFYAELKRLKFIISAVEDPQRTAGRPVFFILDEILKGTNSRDRHTGAKALIRQLVASNGAGLIATHDLELAELEAEADGQMENWAMEVDINDGELAFDYKIKRGVSQSFNATILMQRMGIQIQDF
ncbi:MAG: hypothetical protein AAGJ82_00015 [Bacteroidota bacterium]